MAKATEAQVLRRLSGRFTPPSSPRRIRPVGFFLAALLMAAMVNPAVSTAGMINLLISNFDVSFDGATGEITDFNRPDGGNQDPNESRTVSSIEFEVDGVSEEVATNPPDALFADLKITNLGSELTTDALIQDAGGSGDPTAFGFDFFTSALGGVDLQLGIDDISYTVVTTPIPGLNFFNFFAEAKVLNQDLPGSIPSMLPDALISYTATEVMVLTGQNGVRTLVASGQLTVTANMVPEPSAVLLLSLGCAGLVCWRLRGRQADVK